MLGRCSHHPRLQGSSANDNTALLQRLPVAKLFVVGEFMGKRRDNEILDARAFYVGLTSDTDCEIKTSLDFLPLRRNDRNAESEAVAKCDGGRGCNVERNGVRDFHGPLRSCNRNVDDAPDSLRNPPDKSNCDHGPLGRNRTCNRRFRKSPLCPVELQEGIAAQDNAESTDSAIYLHLRFPIVITASINHTSPAVSR